jgi:hypothetical protein
MGWYKPRCPICLDEGVALEILMWRMTRWCRTCAIEKGGTIGRRKVAVHDAKRGGFTPSALQAMADGGILDPNVLFLPDGKLSMDEARRREQLAVEALPPDPTPSPPDLT